MLPRLLVIDDLFGRDVQQGRNTDRENLCAQFLWQDVTGDTATHSSRQKILKPTAEAVFYRGQSPIASSIGSKLENDLVGALIKVREGWTDALYNGEPPWTMVLLDLCFYTGRVTEESNRRTPGMPEGRPGDDDPQGYFGLTLLDAIHKEFPELPIFILSSKPREEVSLEFSKRGALGFIDRSDLRGPELLQEALWHHGLLPDPTGEIVGHSLPVLLALREARRAARHRENLLIRGERGTGKELMARYLHRMADEAQKKKRPLVTVNTPVLSSTLFSSELFGIMPNTATGVGGKTGLIEAADGGDLFLDEIGDMLPEVQAAILRVLQERQITPVGARKAKSVDVRFLSATNAALEDGARFRPELFDRLRLGGTICLPPLRDRKNDIPLLAERFVREAESRQGAMRRTIAPEVFTRLAEHNWPGNIRELRTCLFDAVNRHHDVEHLVPGHLRLTPTAEVMATTPATTTIPTVTQPALSAEGLDVLLSRQAALYFDDKNIAEWSGRLAEVQRAQAWLLARYLLAALTATKRRTPEHPEGIIQIHPAVKLLTGDATLTASRAADVIKRLLGPLGDELDGELREAYTIALRLRPKASPIRSCACHKG